jgi:predicted HTH transcriptional regulator
MWKRFAGNLSDPPAVILDKLRLTTNNDTGVKRLTVAAVLLATKAPNRHIPNAIMEAVAYRGIQRDSNYQLDARTITGPIDEQVREALAFVRRNMRVAARKDPGRIEIPQYSIRAVFKSLVNAVAHRDYSIYGSKIRLFMFDDRLELFSPGTIPNSLTLDCMALMQSTRNELITSLLARCFIDSGDTGLGRQFMMKKRGEGVPIIFTETLKLAGKNPEYRLLDDAELLLTLPSA